MKKNIMNWLNMLAVLLFCCLLGASQVEAGSISGVVTESGAGTPIASLLVGVYSAEDESDLVATGRTDADGHYSVNDLSVDSFSYKVRFITYGKNYLEEWYNNSPDFAGAGSIDLTSAVPDFTANAELAVGGTITGTVTYSPGPPTGPVYVQAYVQDALEWVASAVVNSDGGYSLIGLPAGGYDVFFWAYEAGYVSKWYSGVPTQATATPVVVVQGDVESGINIQLEQGAQISGRVTDADGGIAGAMVEAYDNTGYYILRGIAITDTNGDYTIAGLPVGASLRVRFFESEGNGNGSGMTEWYNDKSNFESANPVTAGDPSSIDALLEPNDIVNLIPIYMLLGLL
ncbi:MAG: carboxypeptidase regulatory-like domain-containing protein [Candidatus Electrothrix sp. AX5]|nr:carboxypeptidase regulatory-like domain-containing protein [Candidatus Electrothrix sp. AX5]